MLRQGHSRYQCLLCHNKHLFFFNVLYFRTLWKAGQGKEGWPSLYCEVHWQFGNHIGLTLHRAFETQGFICREGYNKYIYLSWTTNHSPVGFWTLISRWGKSQQAGAISVAVTNHNSSDSHHQMPADCSDSRPWTGATSVIVSSFTVLITPNPPHRHNQL